MIDETKNLSPSGIPECTYFDACTLVQLEIISVASIYAKISTHLTLHRCLYNNARECTGKYILDNYSAI